MEELQYFNPTIYKHEEQILVSYDYLPVSINYHVGKPRCLAGVGGRARVPYHMVCSV